MRGGSHSRAALLAALLGTLLIALVGSGASRADSAPTVRDRALELQRAERSAVLQLYAAESSLAAARATSAALDRRAADAATREQAATHQARLVRRSLALAQQRAGATLRALYMDGTRADPLAVLLGAESLEAALDGLDGLAHVTREHQRLVAELSTRASELRRTVASARAERRAADLARADARRAAGGLAAAVAARSATVARIRRASRATTAQLASLEARAREARQRSDALQAAARAESEPATPQAPASVPNATTVADQSPPRATDAASAPATGGTRTLVVDAVAYHLTGRTASGLPVGVGVIAVDPAVIPLGTRVYVPGYGPAVAADVGSAVKGNLIDLWMPTDAQARAWGRRTVTITVYG